MRVEQLATGVEFAAASEQVRGQEPLLTNVISSITSSVLQGREYEECFWWVVRDDAGQVVGCALRTAPHNLVVSPMPSVAASALGAAVAAVDRALPGVNGPTPVVRGVVDACTAARPDLTSVTRMTDVLRVLGRYVPPRPVAGQALRAVPDDTDLLVAWSRQFAVDAGLPLVDPAASVADRLARGGFWWWVVDGQPVSLAGYAPLVDSGAGVVGRIGPVFTPSDHRRHGFGAAVTAAAVDDLLPRCATVMLYADADNATSNGVYARMGFETVAEVVEVDLVRA